MEGFVKEELCSKVFQDLSNNTPVCGTEVCTKGYSHERKSLSAMMYNKVPMMLVCNLIWQKADLTLFAP